MYSPPQQETQNLVPNANYPLFIPQMNSTLQKLFDPTSAISYGPNVQLPMQKVYNINLPGPTGKHAEVDRVYEIVLPEKIIMLKSNTIGERLQIYEIIRQVLIKTQEGENISLDQQGQNNLQSYFRFISLNPAGYNVYQKNPYRSLPYGLLVYNSCFPIRLENYSQRISCAKDSLTINIRLYCLTKAEYYSRYYMDSNYLEYDVWRELSYYEYVRENIIKPKISPNFVLEYVYLNSPNNTTDFYKMKSKQLTQKQKLTKEYDRFKELMNRKPSRDGTLVSMIPPTFPIKKLPDEIDPGLQKYSGNILVVITEAPHMNIYQWASKIYKKDGIVQAMVNFGFYDDAVWGSVLFQIASALCVMQNFCLCIRDMTMQDNVYIRDLKSNGNIIGYWKYIINGIPYYIPNYGYLVMIDTNFKDIYSDSMTGNPVHRLYKIYANIYGQKYDEKQLKQKVYMNYKRILNTNAFSKEYTQNNVNRPPDSTMRLLINMTADLEENISTSIFNHFKRYLHNRIGTYLKKDTEVPNIREFNKNMKKGELIIEIVADNTYKWVMYISTKQEDGVIEICTKESPENIDYQIKLVNSGSLKKYAEGEYIEQSFNGGTFKLTEAELLETYIIN